VLSASRVLPIAELLAPVSAKFGQYRRSEFIQIIEAAFPGPIKQLSIEQRLALASRSPAQMTALLVVEECLDRATDRHPLWLDRIFRRVERAFRGVAVFYRVRDNLGFLPAPGLRRFPDLATGNCAAKPFGAAAAAPETIRAFRAVRGVAGVNEDSHQKRSDGRERLRLGQTAVQKRYKIFGQAVSG